MHVAVFGMGYVGCVTAACLAAEGHHVVGVEIVQQKVDELNRGESPIVEPGLGELLVDGVRSGRFSATLDYETAVTDSDLVLIAVGTPTSEDGVADLSFLRTVCQGIGSVIARSATFKTVMVRSTIPPGTARDVVIAEIEQASGRGHGEGFGVLFCPEFLREATAIADFYGPPFTVIGAQDASHAQVGTELFAFLEAPTIVVDLATAESIKYACNAFHALKVAFANELARVFHEQGSNPREVMRIFTQDRELNISPRYLRPGFAYGGSCLPKDLRALVAMGEANGVAVPLLTGIRDSNAAHIEAAVSHVLAVGAKRVTIFGLTFKAATDDLRESPYVRLAGALRAQGLDISIYDPIVDTTRLLGANLSFAREVLPDLADLLADSAEAALEGTDAIVLGSSSAEIYDAVLAARPRPILDLVGNLPESVEAELRSRESGSGSSLFAGISW